VNVSNYYYITRDSVALGGEHGSPHSPPSLTWSPLADAIEAGEVNSFSLLRWDSRLVETLYGRAEAQEKILSWARGSRNAALARLIQGEGGAGKTRLAAEVAKALRNEGWTAGFLPRNTTEFYFPANPNGVLLIVDYPEEQPERTKALLDRLAGLAETTHPLRVLFLSRRPYDQWIEQATNLGGRFGRQAIAAPQPLTVEDAEALIAEAAHRFRAVAGPAGVKGLSLAVFDPSRVRSWLGQEEKHRLPLYAAAAAVQAVLDPAKAFGQTGAEVLTSLVLREFDRVRPASEAIGLGKDGLITLLALGVLGDGLTQDQIGDLIGLGVGAAENAEYFDRLAESPWWQQGRLLRLEPDALAAAFLNRALFPSKFPQGRKELPDWLYAALRTSGAALTGRLERVLFDLLSIAPREGGGHALEDALVDCVKREPERARAFEVFATKPRLWSARFAAEVMRNLVLSANTDGERAAHLTNLSGHVRAFGDVNEGLVAAETAINILRNLEKTHPGKFLSTLATSLNNKSVCLTDIGQWGSALFAIEESVEILRGLVQINPEIFSPQLASSLNNLSNCYDGLGRVEEAIINARESINIRRKLYKINPELFGADLANSLSNISIFLASVRRLGDALFAAEEAVEIFRNLVQIYPELFLSDFATSLNNFSNHLLSLNKSEEALSHIKEAVRLRRNLAKARPEVFLSSLAGSLSNLSNCLSIVKDFQESLLAIEESVRIRRFLVQSNSLEKSSDLANSLNNQARCYALLGRWDDALVSIDEAICLYRKLVLRESTALRKDLRNALYGLSTVLDALGRTEEAAAAAAEAAGLGD
jgi:tetratricopeptide (TPR) repeat protein